MRRSGILFITANELDSAHAYKVFKFKEAIKKAASAIDEANAALLKEVGIKDAKSFDEEYAKLHDSGADPEKFAQMDAKMARLRELRKQLFDEDLELEGVKTLPFEQFHELQKENKDLPGKPLNTFEAQLEDVLWVAPEE